MSNNRFKYQFFLYVRMVKIILCWLYMASDQQDPTEDFEQKKLYCKSVLESIDLNANNLHTSKCTCPHCLNPYFFITTQPIYFYYDSTGIQHLYFKI